MGRSTTAAPTELWLRFACRGCGHRLTVSLADRTAAAVRCPRCQQKMDVPAVDETTCGYDTVPHPPPPEIAIACPNGCGTLHTTADQIGRSKRCPSCRSLLTLQFTAAVEVTPPPRPAATAPSAPEPLIYGIAETPRGAAFPKLTSAPGSARTVWRLVYWPLQFLAPFALLMAAAHLNQPKLLLGAVLLALPRVTHPLSSAIAAALVPTFRCRGCHEEFEAVGRWNCSCGYHDYRERHVFNFRCPMCRKVLGWTNCQRCDATIFLR